MRLKKKFKILFSIIAAIVAIIILIMSFYLYSLTPIDKNNKEKITFVVKSGSGKKEIINNLKTAGIIRSKTVAYVYSFLHKNYVLKAGSFEINKSMSMNDIFTTLDGGKTLESKGINVALKEGKRYTDYIETLTDKLDVKEQDFNKLMNDKEYLTSLINEYWFLSEDILNEEIYYPLEGYLFPDTYNFRFDADAKTIIKTILDNTKNKLDKYQKDIQNNNMRIHEILTLASIVELEGKRSEERYGIASVFINRIDSNIPLGSDVTTYYASKKDFSSDLTASELSSCNSYNTRCPSYLGLPIGPVSNPGITSILAALYPDDNDYLFFVSDKNGKIYFSKNNTEHEQTIAELKATNMWYEYE